MCLLEGSRFHGVKASHKETANVSGSPTLTHAQLVPRVPTMSVGNFRARVGKGDCDFRLRRSKPLSNICERNQRPFGKHQGLLA